jgi:hypothetical protein
MAHQFSQASDTGKIVFYIFKRSRDSSVGIATGYDWMAAVRFPTGTTYFSFLHMVQTVSGDHPASSAMGKVAWV